MRYWMAKSSARWWCSMRGHRRWAVFFSMRELKWRFKDAEDALNQTNAVAAGTPTDELVTWHGILHGILDSRL